MRTRSKVRQLGNFKDFKAIAVEGSNTKLSKSVRCRMLRDFDVERFEILTSNAQRFPRRMLEEFDSATFIDKIIVFHIANSRVSLIYVVLLS